MLLAVLLLLAGLPLAVSLSLRTLAETALSRQAGDFNALITSVRDYYAPGVDLYIDTGAIADEARRIRAKLAEAVSPLDRLVPD